ncbi:MAG TPA: PAS domain S-box protein [Bacteroidales bacterium]|nr:PAS domain S-box protein [Bacteroidales bacterium]
MKIFPGLSLSNIIILNFLLTFLILLPLSIFLIYRSFKLFISEKAKAVKEAHKNEEKFEKLLMTSSDAISINDLAEGKFILVNKGFSKTFQYKEEEILEKSVYSPDLWNDPEDLYKILEIIHENGIAENVEFVLKKKDGTTFNALLSASLVNWKGECYVISVTKDITNIKMIEGELFRDQLLLDAMMNNLSDYIYLKDCDSRFLRINKSSSNEFGLKSPDEIIGKTDRDFYLEEDAKLAFEDEQEIVRTGKTIIKEEKLTYHNGRDMWLLTTKMPLLSKDGKIVGTFGLSKDISELKKLTEDLRLKKIQLEAIMENIPDQIYYKDRNSKFILCNTPVALMAGCTSPEELAGKSDFDFQPIRIANKYFEDEQQLMKEGKPLLNFEEPIYNRKTGEMNYNLSSKLPVRNTEGKVIGLVGINRDITELKKHELERHVIHEIIRGVTITSNLDELLELIHQAISKVLYAENCFVALCNEINGFFSFPYFADKIDPKPEPSEIKKSLTAFVFRTKKPLLLTNKIFKRLKDTNEVELIGTNSRSWIGIPLQTPSKVIGVLVLQDYEREDVYSENDLKFLISIGSQIAFAIERKKSEKEIKLKNEMYQAANEEKDKFFSILAHDLRGPLSSFVAATQLITEEVQSMSLKEIKEITQSMKTSATNVFSLLENLLEWSRLQRGTIDFVPVRFNLKEKIQSCIDIMLESFKKKNIDIEVNVPDGICLFADAHMFDSVIRNLVSNAIKFTYSGGKVIISGNYNDDFLIEVRVTDSGIGISPELKNKLFKLNEKTNRKGTEGEPSTGLGLLLCKEFVEKHGGTIWVESEVGKGSSFCFAISGKTIL